VEIHHPKTMTTPVKFQLRRDTATNWSTNNPILLLGEPGFDSTNNQLRIGDGVTGWNSLNQVDVKGNGGVALGYAAGYTGQGLRAVSVGYQAGQYGQGIASIAIGASAGQTGQGSNSIAIGTNAGQTGQASNAIAIGSSAGSTGQYPNTVAIGTFSGKINQKEYAVAIGFYAGSSEQQTNAVAIGQSSGFMGQQTNAIAIGQSSGLVGQQTDAIAIGTGAGGLNQASSAIAIGSFAGYTGQGTNSIAIGANAGVVSQPNYTTIINATSEALNGVTGQTGSFYVAPVRSDNTQTLGLAYNTSTKEIVTSTALSSTGSTGSTGNTGNTGPTGPTGPGNGVASLNPYASFVTNKGATAFQTINPINYNVAPNFPSRADVNTISYWNQAPPSTINGVKSIYCGGSVVTITGITGGAGEYFLNSGFVPTVTGLYQISANFFMSADGAAPEPISFGHCNPQIGNIGNVWVSLDRVSATVLSANTDAGVPLSASMSFSDILTAGTKYCFVGGGYGAISGPADAQGGPTQVYNNSQATFALLSTNVTAIDGTSP